MELGEDGRRTRKRSVMPVDRYKPAEEHCDDDFDESYSGQFRIASGAGVTKCMPLCTSMFQNVNHTATSKSDESDESSSESDDSSVGSLKDFVVDDDIVEYTSGAEYDESASDTESCGVLKHDPRHACPASPVKIMPSACGNRNYLESIVIHVIAKNADGTDGPGARKRSRTICVDSDDEDDCGGQDTKRSRSGSLTRVLAPTLLS